MSNYTLLSEPDHVNEPEQVQGYRGLMSQVAETHQPVVVRRDGANIAAVIAMEHLELLQDLLARREAEDIASRVDWAHAAQVSPSPQYWFEGKETKPL